MKRFWIGVGLLVVLLAAGIWIMVASDRVHAPISGLLEEAARESLAGDLAAGQALAQQAEDQWQQHWKAVASGGDHNPMDEIDGLFAQARAYGLAGQAADFGACCARLAELVEAMGESHSLSWWNFL